MRAPSGGGACSGVARWSRSVAPAAAQPALPTHGKVPHDEHINQRFAIWQGDISTLDAEAITNTTDETLLESNAVSDRILQAAGPDLKEEILMRTHECQPGEVVVTPGFNLRCRHILHTVSPKYNPSYCTASETALQNCYKDVLSKASELGVRSLALCLIATPKKNFPPELAALVALRSIRQHLEQNKTPHLIILATSNDKQRALVTSLAPHHFPRDARDRRVRIIHNPRTDDTDEDSEACDEDAAVEAATMFARACAPDTQRLLAPARILSPQLQLADDHHDVTKCIYNKIYNTFA